jgi:high-affinity nickel permease
VARHEITFLGVISLPLLFAACMTLTDTATAAFMRHALRVGLPRPGAPDFLQHDLGHPGYGMVAVSIVTWAGAAIVWKKHIQPKEGT